ncbi:MAG: lysoplasmalogenase [Pseudomonadota bacterium]|nr:lysoplasmalogenase [Pseudomonadota bacterium]
MPPLWWGAALAGVAYLVVVTRGGAGWLRAVKALPALLLAALLAPVSALAAVGMVFSAAGDAFLLDKQRFFLHGLAAFLVAHVLFVPAFVLASGRWPSPVVAGVLAVLAVTGTVLVRPRSGRMRVAVPIYAVTLAAMAAAASTLGPLGLAGGALFLASDTLLAVNQFKRPIPGRDFLVLGTYYGALLTLSAALLSA